MYNCIAQLLIINHIKFKLIIREIIILRFIIVYNKIKILIIWKHEK